MKRLIIGLLFLTVLSTANAGEDFLTTVSGTTAQTYVAGFGAKIAIFCTTSVRYKLGNAALATAPTTSNSMTVPFPGDWYRITLKPNQDRIILIHADGATAFSCDIAAAY